ncbi:MAG: hypothetical protein WBG48_03830 [Pricia sp.]
MENKKTDWEASDSSPVDTKQKDGIGVRNQTTNSSKSRVPIVTIVVIVILLAIVGFFLFV